jgi:hypothetical protein
VKLYLKNGWKIGSLLPLGWRLLSLVEKKIIYHFLAIKMSLILRVMHALPAENGPIYLQ